jgi:hypothetical protein
MRLHVVRFGSAEVSEAGLGLLPFVLDVAASRGHVRSVRRDQDACGRPAGTSETVVVWLITQRPPVSLLALCAPLTTSQVTSRDGTIFVRFGRHDVPVPDPLGVILTELTRAGRTHTGTGAPATTPWLFPGGLTGRPITASRLGQRLNRLGIYAMAGRRAALTDLASQLPAAVLADLLHLAPGTAVRWMRQAGGDWNRYAADLARTRNHQHGNSTPLARPG